MEGSKGIPACPKYPFLPGLGLAGKRLLSEVPYNLVSFYYNNRKNGFYVNVEKKIFSYFVFWGMPAGQL